MGLRRRVLGVVWLGGWTNGREAWRGRVLQVVSTCGKEGRGRERRA